ncbi:MAG: hypothetical protein AAGM40_19455 [Cyanobacteria bacterium J06573_2]
MKLTKLLSLSLVAFVLFGCNQTPAASNNEDVIESIDPSISEDQDSDSGTETNTDNTNKVEPSKPKIKIGGDNRQDKIAKQIGGKFDCNGDGISNGARIDYNGDGIPDECIESGKKAKSLINETSYNTALKSLNSLTKGCKESTTTPQATKYTICKNGGKIAKASEYNSEAGAGLDFWFVNNRVIAVQRPHSQELFLYDNSGKLKSKFNYPRKANISNADRQDAKLLYNGYNRIVAAFDNSSSGQSSSQNGIIDETSFQTFSKSLEAITKGCQKTKKSEQGSDYEICKKGNTIVSASEYVAEADAGSVYWFSPNGRVIAMRYFSSGDSYAFDSNGKVTSKFNVYNSKKVNNISGEERKLIEGESYSGYKRILNVFGI